MGKLLTKNFLLGLVFVLVTVISTVLISVIFILLMMSTNWTLSIWLFYIVCILVALTVCFIQRKFYFAKKPYYYPEEINNTHKAERKHKFWIERIRSGKFIKRNAAMSIYILYLILGLAALGLVVLGYRLLQNVDGTFFVVICIPISAALCAFDISLLFYGIFGLRSLHVCKKCGAVNAFIYDEYLDFITASGFNGNLSYNSGVKHHGVSSGNWIVRNAGRVTKYGDMISRHCACCGEKSVSMCNTVNETNVIHPSYPTKR